MSSTRSEVGRLKKKEESQREVQTWHSWEAEPLISPCFKPPWKWGQWEFSSPPQSICLSNGVSWGQGSAVAQAENDIKGGRVPSVPSPPCSESAHIWFSFFSDKIPHLSPSREPAGDISPAPHGSSCLGRLVLPPGYQGPADAKPHSGLLFCKTLTGFEEMKSFGYLQVPSQHRGSAGVKRNASAQASSERRGLTGRCGCAARRVWGKVTAFGWPKFDMNPNGSGWEGRAVKCRQSCGGK